MFSSLLKARYLPIWIFHKLFSGFYSLGWQVGFSFGARIKNPGMIQLGRNVFLGRSSFIHVPDEHEQIGGDAPKLVLGDHVTVGDRTMINAAQSIIIENHVLIAPNCYITDHNHGYTDVTTPVKYQKLMSVAPVLIKSGSWLGASVSIGPGVTIGKNSVIGANSVVTKDVPDFSVAVGVPAKVIKNYNQKSKRWESA